jgi:small subunit ribosomal protein S20
LREESNKEEAVKFFPKVASMIDKLAKRNVIHKNKASNLKSGLAVHINKL